MTTATLIAPSADNRTSDQVQALTTLFTRLGEVSGLPTTAQKVISLTDDEDASGSELREAIESDPALAVRVLRRANSAYYGLRNKVADLQMAINLLGFREVRNLAITVSVARMFTEPGDYRTYTREGLWEHMVAVAVTSRLISKVCGRGEPETAYSAGLLHDVGLILLDQYMRKYFSQVIDELDVDVSTDQVERRILPFDHTELGAFVTGQWRFPQPICEAIRFHHEPEQYDGPNRDIVNIVAVANYLCSRSGWTSLGVANVAPLPESIYGELDLGENKLSSIVQRLSDTLADASALAAL